VRNLFSRFLRKQRVTKLTKQEIFIWKLIAKGKRNREIATELGISERTVKNHITRLFKEIGVRNRTEAAIKFDRR